MIAEAAKKAGRTFQLPDAFGIAESVAEPLKQAGWNCSPNEYSSFTLLSTVFSAAATLATAMAAGVQAASAAAYSLLAAAIALAALSRLPKKAAGDKARELESCLPIALPLIASELESGTSFEAALESVKGCGEFGRQAASIRKAVSKGRATYSQAFEHASKQTSSMLAKRVFAQLYVTYSRGGAPDALRKLADEAIQKQKQAVREHAAKTAFLGTVFIAVSAIIPAFFGAYAVISSSLLESTFSPVQVVFFFVAVFPLADLVVLAYARQSAPKGLATK